MCHLLDRNSGPAAYNFCNVLSIYLFLDHGAFTLQLLESLLDCDIFVFLLFYLGIAYFRNLGIIAFAFCTVSFVIELLDINFILLNLIDLCFLCLPFGTEGFLCVAKVGKILVNLFEFIFILLAFDSLALNLKLFDFS